MHKKAGNCCRLFVFLKKVFHSREIAKDNFLICEIIEYLCYSNL